MTEFWRAPGARERRKGGFRSPIFCNMPNWEESRQVYQWEPGPEKDCISGCKESYSKRSSKKLKQRKKKERKPTIISSRELKINTIKQIS